MIHSLGGGSYSCHSLDIEAFGIWTKGYPSERTVPGQGADLQGCSA